MKFSDFERENLNEIIKNAINVIPSEISRNIESFIFSKSKRIRPYLIFLSAKAMNIEISGNIFKLAAAVELIHNATLIHDDIIDDAEKRRGRISLNKEIGNNLSVLSGDILLSVAMKLIAELKSIEIIEVFASALQKMCIGEINQNSSLNKLPSQEEYILKSQNKTAELFSAGLESLCIISGIKEKEREKIKNFALNYGIAFQIKDDLNNILKTDKTKPELSDIYNGIYTLPVIFLAKENKNFRNLKKDEIINLISKNPDVTAKTKDVIKEYIHRAIASLEFMQDNQYKNKLIELTEELYKVF